MFRFMAALLCAGLLSAVGSGPAFADVSAALSIHLTSPSYSGCATIDPAEMTCQDIDVEGNARNDQYAFVLASGIGSLAGVEFGIAYDASVEVLGWNLCTGGMEIPENGWPVSGTGNAITWSMPQHPTSTDSLVVVGYFIIGRRSSGKLSAEGDPRIGDAIYVDEDGDPFSFADALGVADVAGKGQGYSPCEGVAGPSGPDAPESLPDGSAGAESDVFTGGSQSMVTNVYDCGDGPFGFDRDVNETVGSGYPDVSETPSIAQAANLDERVPDGPGVHILAVVEDTVGDDHRFLLRLKSPTLELERLQGDPDDLPSAEISYHPRKHLLADNGLAAYYVGEASSDSPGEGRNGWAVRFVRNTLVSSWEREIHIGSIDGDDFIGGAAIDPSFLYIGGYSINEPDPRGRSWFQARRCGPPNAGEIAFSGEGPVVNAAIGRVFDVALDLANFNRFYVVGEFLDDEGSAIHGYDLSTGELAHRDPFRNLGYSVRGRDIELDENGSIYLGGEVVLETGEPRRLFMARDNIGDGIGTSYFTPYLGDSPSNDREPAFGALTVSEAGLAFATGRAYFDASFSYDAVTWRTGFTGDVRWDTVIGCFGLDKDTSDDIQYRELDLSVLVVGATSWPAGGCTEASGIGPCTHVFRLDSVSGGLEAAGYGDPANINQIGPSSVRDLTLDEGTGDGTAVFVLSTETKSSGGFPVLHAFNVPLDAVVGVSEPTSSKAEAGVVVRAAGGRLLVHTVGVDDGPTDIHVFDVAGRLVRKLVLPPRSDSAEITGLASGAYCVRVHSERTSKAVTAVVVR